MNGFIDVTDNEWFAFLTKNAIVKIISDYDDSRVSIT